MSNFVLSEVLDQADQEGLALVWKETYGEDVIGMPGSNPDSPRTYLLGRVDGEPAFGCILHEFQIVSPIGILKTAGVGAVGTRGQYRNLGVGKQGMIEAHKFAFGQGFVMACLYGFRESFYRKVGYETCGWRWQLKMPVDRMPKLAPTLSPRQIQPEDASSLNSCYQKFIEGFSGSSLRSPGQWQNRLGKSPPIIYAFGEDEIESYFWFKAGGFYDDLEVGEFAWTTARGYESALATMRAMAINKSFVVWVEPQKSPFLARFSDHGLVSSHHRPSMFRVLNAPQILTDANTGNVPLNVSDPHVGGNFVEHPKGLAIGVGALAQLILGQHSATELLAFGSATGSTDAAKALDQLFPQRSVTCMEFF